MSNNKIDFKKIGELMCWERMDNQTWEDVFTANGKKTEHLPNFLLVEIQHAGGLLNYINKHTFESMEEIQKEIMRIFRITINQDVFLNNGLKNHFPTLLNFYLYVQKLDRAGKLYDESLKLAETSWHSVMMTRILKRNTDKMFSNKPDKELYKVFANKVKQIYKFSDLEIDKIRYYVCQTRAKNLNSSLNKNLWIWAKEKETGKTTIARAIAGILNGENEISGKYESDLKTELQYNDHALPRGCMFNSVILDEAQPKDSAKSYGSVKTAITSSMITYNQKFGRIIQIPVNRNYIWTSNDAPHEFIQDEDERRFIVIHYNKTPDFLNFKEIFDLWKGFVTNCEPEEDWMLWGKSFGTVQGMASIIKQEYINRIIHDDKIEQLLKYRTGYVPIGEFYDILEKNAKTEQRKLIKEAVSDFAPPVQNSKFLARAILQEIQNRRVIDDVGEEIDKQLLNLKGGTDDMPF